MSYLTPYRCIILLSILSYLGCGAEDFEPKSLFTSYRVIGIKAEPPTLSLAQESVLSVIDFHPNDLDEAEERPTIKYTWRLCPFTLGSMVEYECFLDEVELEADEDGRVKVSPLTLLEQAGELMALFESGEGIPMLPGSTGAPSSIDVYIKLTAKEAKKTPLEIVKKLTLNLNDQAPTNQNPILETEGILIENQASKLKVGEVVTLTAQVKSTSEERYTPIVAEGEKAQEEKEELLIGWLTTGGELDGPYSFMDDPHTELTLPDEPQMVRVFVTVRDGRGGLDVQSIDLNVTK